MELIEDNYVIQFSHSTSMDTRVIEYGAVVAQNKLLINNGQFVKLQDDAVAVTKVNGTLIRLASLF